MRPLSKNADVVTLLVRGALIVAALSTYAFSPDDVVWRFVKSSAHARAWEHVAFGAAAIILGIALFLKLRAGVYRRKQDAARIIAAVLQAIGIGSLLPLPGFLLLVLSDITIHLLLPARAPLREGASAGIVQAPGRNNLSEHIGLCCAFVSMLVFSIVLIDRVADALFAVTAAVSIAISFRDTQRTRKRRS